MIRETVALIAKALAPRAPTTNQTPASAPTPRRDSLVDQAVSLWQNTKTGLGTTKDRIAGHVPGPVIPLRDDWLRNLSIGDPIARKVVNALVDDAFRLGFQVVYRGDVTRSREMLSDIATRGRELGLASKAARAAAQGRLYGGAGILVETNGGLDSADTPLDPLSVRSVDSLSVYDRRDFTVRRWRSAGRGPGDSLFPEHATLSPCTSDLLGLVEVDASRFIAFGGLSIPARDRRELFQGWDASVLQPVWETIRGFNSNHQSTDTMLTDASIPIVKIEDLWKVMTSKGGRALFEERQALQDQYRWSGSAIPVSVSKDVSEGYEFVERTFAGIPDLLREKKFLVAATADMPVSVLFGQSPAGLNATGEHDAKNWHATVRAWQEQRFTPQIRKIAQLIARELKAEDPEEFDIEWPNLEQLTAKEQAELEKLHADTDEIRIGQGFPEETVLLHRHGGDSYMGTPPMLTIEDKAALEAGARSARQRPQEDDSANGTP